MDVRILTGILLLCLLGTTISKENAARQAAEDKMEKPADNTASQPIKKTTEQPIKKTAEQSNKKTAEQPIKTTTEQPNKKTAEQPIKKTTEEPIKTTKEQPLKKTAEKPIKKTTEQPIKKTAEQPIKKTTEQPMKKTTEQPIKKTAEQPIKKTTEQPIKKTTEQPTKKPIEQPIKKTTEQTIEKINLKTTNKKESYKFLAFLPFPSRSHHKVFEPLLKQLALNGHQVTVVTPLPVDEIIPNYKQIVFKNYHNDLQAAMEEGMGTKDHKVVLKMKWFVQQMFLFLMRFMGSFIAEHTFTDPVIQKFLESDETYDAVILEASFMQEINIALAHKFKAVAIEVLTSSNFHWSYWLYGNPYDTSYIADISVPYGDHMTFLERIHNTINSLMIRGIYRLFYLPIYEEQMNKLVRYPGWESRPSMMEMLRNVSLVLVNSHVSLNYPYPMSPHFKEVGGLNLVPEKKLPKDIQEFMDGASDGVIYFSLGSNFNASKVTEDDTLTGLVRLFGRIKQRVLWKYDETNLPGLSKNVKISNWFPQQDILAHKNCKVFITHGGFLSLTESVYYGVPMIGTPILGDQLKNVHHMERFGYGIGIDFFNVTEATMSWALNEILNNPKYRENAKKRSQLFRDKPATALETAVHWTEYAIRHKGAPHLKPAITNMPWYQQAMLDVYSAIALLILIPLLIFYYTLKLLLRCCCYLCCSSKPKDKKIKKKRE